MPPSNRSAVYHQIDDDRAGQRLDNYLLAHLKGVPRSLVYRLVRSGQVRVNSGRVGPSYRIKAGDRVRIPPVAQARVHARQVGPRAFEWLDQRIVFENERVIVIDKPAGLAVHGGSGVELGCIEMLRNRRPDTPALELVHRLDRETSGCLLIAKRRSALRGLHRLLREGMVDKHYLALVAGAWPGTLHRSTAPLWVHKGQGEARVRVAADGKPASTRFEVLRRFGRLATLVVARLDTGRTHQIRVHAAHAGHPIIGDERYGNASVNDRFANWGLKRMFLHASAVAFTWPDTAAPFGLCIPLADDLKAFLASLERIDAEPLQGRRQPDQG